MLLVSAILYCTRNIIASIMDQIIPSVKCSVISVGIYHRYFIV